MLKAIKIRIYPDSVQKDFISKQLGCCRLIYNKLLDYKKTQYKEYKQNTSLSQLGKYLTNLKKQDEYLFPLESTIKSLIPKSNPITVSNFYF